MVAPVLIGGGTIVVGILALVLLFHVMKVEETFILGIAAVAIVYMLYM